MLKRNCTTKVLTVAIVVLTLSCLVKDWVDFAHCGAFNSCLLSECVFQNFGKFTISLLLAVLAFYAGSFACCAQDAKWFRIAFVFSLIADSCFRLLPMIPVELPTSTSILGIVFFMFYQSAMIIRHTRVSDSDSHIPKVFAIPFAILLAFLILHSLNLVSQLVFVVASYGAFLICSVVMGVKAGSLGYFSNHKARLIKIGMIAFFFGDVLVGGSLAMGDSGSPLEMIAAISNNLIWIVYVPAQLLLIKSCGED